MRPRRAALLLALGAVALLAAVGLRSHTPDIDGGIAELATVELGGVEQHILIRGADPANPVLLWLHGGPGAAQMPLAHVTTRALEDHYTVVHWDQRGAGKSNRRGFDPATMTMERFLADTHALTQHLKARLGTDQIVLLGHSWGAKLGLRAAARWPEDYAAFISVAQPVGAVHANPVTLDWLRARAEGADADWLSGIDTGDMDDHATYVRVMRLLDDYGGGMNIPTRRLAADLVRAPEYSLADVARWLHGARRGSGPMWPEYRALDAVAEVPRLAVPAHFLAGRADMNSPLSLIEDYAAGLDAPVIVFEQSGHAPFLTEPERFADTLIALRPAP